MSKCARLPPISLAITKRPNESNWCCPKPAYAVDLPRPVVRTVGAIPRRRKQTPAALQTRKQRKKAGPGADALKDFGRAALNSGDVFRAAWKLAASRGCAVNPG